MLAGRELQVGIELPDAPAVGLRGLAGKAEADSDQATIGQDHGEGCVAEARIKVGRKRRSHFLGRIEPRRDLAPNGVGEGGKVFTAIAQRRKPLWRGSGVRGRGTVA